MQKSLDSLNEIDPLDDAKIEKSKYQDLHNIRKIVLEENKKMKHILLIKNKIKE